MSFQEEVMTENDISEVPAVNSNHNSTLYDRKRQSKAIRVLTVLAYILSVSLAAIFLSIYYIFVWDGQSTLVTKSFPQHRNILETITQKSLHETLTTNGLLFKNTTEGFKRFYTKRGTFENSVKRFVTHERIRQDFNKSRELFENELLNNTESLLSPTIIADHNSSFKLLSRDELLMGLPEPTVEDEDSTFLPTMSTDEFTTELPELNDYNSEFNEFNKSFFIKKLFGQRNAIEK